MLNTEKLLAPDVGATAVFHAANDSEVGADAPERILRVVRTASMPEISVDEPKEVPLPEGSDKTDEIDTTECSADGRPLIKIIPAKIRERLALAQRCLLGSGSFFERSGAIVKLHRDSISQEITIRDLNTAAMIRALDEVAVCQRFDKRLKDWVDIDPPENFCMLLMKSGTAEGLQPLAGLARQPYLRPDGSLCALPSYDSSSKLYGVFEAGEFVMPESPTRVDAEAALGRLDDLIREFPFAAGSDHSAALAAILTAAARPSLPQAPMFHVRAHEPGTGKSYLCSVITGFATPRAGSPLTFPGSNDECDKVMLAELTRSPAVIEFDNLTSDILAYKKLCTVLTSERMTGRVLGASRTTTVGTRVLFLSSGNNVGPVADMARRCVTINLDAKEEIPAARTFSRTDLLEHLRRNRAAYVIDALTVIRAWILAGEPMTPCRSLASYDAWSRWSRQPLLWLGRDDPATSVFQTMMEDPERESLGLLLTAWHSKFDNKPVMVRDLIEWTSGLEPAGRELREVLIEIAGERDNVNRRRLGWWLKRHAGQIAHSLRIQKAPRKGNAEAWKVVSV